MRTARAGAPGPRTWLTSTATRVATAGMSRRRKFASVSPQARNAPGGTSPERLQQHVHAQVQTCCSLFARYWERVFVAGVGLIALRIAFQISTGKIPTDTEALLDPSSKNFKRTLEHFTYTSSYLIACRYIFGQDFRTLQAAQALQATQLHY